MDGLSKIPFNTSPQTMKLTRIRTLKVIGEAVGQVVVESRLAICARKIDRIKFALTDIHDHIFANKIVRQGNILKDIFYVDRQGILRSITEKVPFMLVVDIPGLKAHSKPVIQNHRLDIEADYRLTPPVHHRPGCLRQIVVARIFMSAAEWVQMDVMTLNEIRLPAHSGDKIVS